MNRHIWITTLLMLFMGIVSSLSIGEDRPPTISFCDLLSAPQKYDKNVVETQAVIQSTYHEVHLSDFRCKSTKVDDHSASIELPDDLDSTKLGKKLSRVLRRNHSANIVFDGVFYGTGGPYGQEKTRFRFILKGLVSVQELPKTKNHT